MKLLIALLFVLPIAANAQTHSKQNRAMEKFQQFYNAGQGDSVNAMFKYDPSLLEGTEPMWSNKTVAEVLKEYGSLQSFKYIGIDNMDPQKVYVFQMRLSKAGLKTISFTLDKDLYFRTFRFVTTSEGITALLNKQKRVK